MSDLADTCSERTESNLAVQCGVPLQQSSNSNLPNSNGELQDLTENELLDLLTNELDGADEGASQQRVNDDEGDKLSLSECDLESRMDTCASNDVRSNGIEADGAVSNSDRVDTESGDGECLVELCDRDSVEKLSRDRSEETGANNGIEECGSGLSPTWSVEDDLVEADSHVDETSSSLSRGNNQSYPSEGDSEAPESECEAVESSMSDQIRLDLSNSHQATVVTGPDDESPEPECESAEPEDELLEPESESAEPEDELLEPECESADPEDESMDPEDDLLEHDSDLAEPGCESAEPEDESMDPEDELPEPDNESAEPEDELQEPECESAGPEDDQPQRQCEQGESHVTERESPSPDPRGDLPETEAEITEPGAHSSDEPESDACQNQDINVHTHSTLHSSHEEPDAPESDTVNHSSDAQSSRRGNPPVDPTTAAQNVCDSAEALLSESPSTESMNNAPEDEQSHSVPVVGDVLPDGDVIPSDDVITSEERPEDDQFEGGVPANVNDVGTENRVNCENASAVVASMSGHRGSSDDELLCTEADLASRLSPPESSSQPLSQSSQRTSPPRESGSQPTSAPDTERCCEPECDQPGQNGSPDENSCENPDSATASLESVPLSSNKDDDFGDFVQSEPSSPQLSPEDKNKPKTLLALADTGTIDTNKLNVAEIVHISRRSSQLSDSDNDVMARSTESLEDVDDVITVTSYRELLKRYQQLREQKAGAVGLHHPSSGQLDQLQTEIDELKEQLTVKDAELDKTQQKLEHHDQAAKRTIAQLQNEMKTRVDQVTKMYDDVLSEKDSMVVKFAQQELKNTEFLKKQEAMEARFRDMAKDREVLVAKLKGASVDKSKLSAQLHAKHTELINTQKEVHKLKDAMSSQDVKVKWAHNKLKNELESHKETKTSLERTMIKLKEAREETDTIRRNCQQMIKTYQESEDIKSNSLDQKLKEKMEEMKQRQQEQRDQDEVHQMIVNELESLKRKHKDALEELQTLKDKVLMLDQERSTQEKCITTYRDSLQLTKRENDGLTQRLDQLENIREERDKAVSECEEMRLEMERIRQQDKEFSLEAENCRQRETQLLELTEKLTNKNAHLQSENTSLNTKNSSALSEIEHLKNNVDELTKTVKTLKEQLHDQETRSKLDMDKLNKSLNEKTQLCSELKRTVDEKFDEIKVIKRRQAASIKDLTRQLQQAKRRCEAQEPAPADKADSIGSRTSSSNSLDTMSPANHQDSSDGVTYLGSDPPNSVEFPGMAETPVVRHVEPDKQMLIERIVKLQRINARKSEKIEFLEDHINQLLTEIKKKNRLIQHYVTREEAGTLASNSSDNVKSPPQAQLTKRGGIMASLYSSHSADQSMTLDLSLQINSKLQAVLEDTLLKNITLKENIDTLGEEIARLSQENRQMKLNGVADL